MNESVYLVVGVKQWNRRAFNENLRDRSGDWHFVGKPEELTVELVRRLCPRYIFFLHWSCKVPAEIVDDFECVCFHMTDVPFGRGGSPLQNLILRGHRKTKLTALRMTAAFDAGPVYLKKELSLEGSAEEILMRAGALSVQMIVTIIEQQPAPVPQLGEPTIFKRRKPEESAIPVTASLGELHDFIRMLDAEGYPKAFISHGNFQYDFSRAVQYDGRIVADVVITLSKETKA